MKTDKKEWVRSILKKRRKEGSFDNLIVENRLKNDGNFFNFFKVTPKQYEHLLSIVEPRIKKRHTNFRESITAKDRLAVTLRFLASGSLMTDISDAFQIGKSTVSGIILETCEAITDVLQPLVMARPSTEKWLDIAEDFSKLWQIPHCLGAIDVKHIEIIQPTSGVRWTHSNFKGAYTFTLLAVADSHYKFVLVDGGAPGHLCDKVILKNSSIGHQLKHGLLSLPAPEVIPETNIMMPYSFIGDTGFPLQENLMRPYQGPNLSEGQEIFNYKLSQARQCVEKAFSLMSMHFHIFQSPISARVETAVAAVEAAACLHNYIMSFEDRVPIIKRLYNT